ncbi:hypothetical protein KIK06_10655 [Nocardiopsis sp. EMB25]|uniref:hypothetical protein n=1 Tax=Nocardiopsis sp. EMB25 TaxID=2835867 RepID=UPI002284F80C|nr:hypothetical protein [Nocardiopsis sp. EMB25]MCY9784350.1 hypothetical protein [Nocardiopsis sp. EMB25]
MTYLHVFDMDGTLLRGTTASLEIARILRCEPQLTDLERRFRRQEIDTRGFARSIHRLWNGLTESDVMSAFVTSCTDLRG